MFISTQTVGDIAAIQTLLQTFPNWLQIHDIELDRWKQKKLPALGPNINVLEFRASHFLFFDNLHMPSF